MNLRNYALVALAPLALLTGCAGPDMTMANPLTAAKVPTNKIVKDHGYAESQRGLPVGSMADEAALEAVSKDEVCVAVSLRELSAIDLTRADVKFTSSTGEARAKITADPASSQTYQGLVEHTEQTGTKVECKTNQGQTTCESKPVYSTTMIAGPVDVFSTRGRLCAQNKDVVTPQTKELSLKVSTPTAAQGPWGGHANKSTTFRWAFQ